MPRDYIELLAVLNIKERYLENTFGRPTLLRGVDYYYKGKVQLKNVDTQDGGSIKVQAFVSGSGDYSYQNTVIIFPPKANSRATNKQLRIESNCACPVGFQCKHGIATLLAFAHFASQNNQQIVQQHQSDIDSWLESLPVHEEEAFDEPFDRNEPFLCYLLKPESPENPEDGLIVETYKLRYLKNGRLSKPLKLSLSQMEHFNGEFYFNDLDEEIADILSPQNGFSYYYHPSQSRNNYDLEDELGQWALDKILLTERCFWQQIREENQIFAGSPRRLELQWKHQGDSYFIGYHMQPPARSLCKIKDLYYVDLAQHCMGKVDCQSLGAEQVLKLLAAPPIPQSQAQAVSIKLLKTWPDVDLPLPVDPGIVDRKIHHCKPRAYVRLSSFNIIDYNTDSGQRRVHQLEVFFDYDGVRICPRHGKARYSQLENLQRITIERDIEAEQMLLARLHQIGFVPVNQPPKNYADQLKLIRPAQSRMASIWAWFEFQEHWLPQLEEEGWIFEYDDSFKLHFDEASQWYAQWDEDPEAGNDWFSMNLGIEVNGERFNLLPPLVELLSGYDTPQDLRQTLLQNEYMILPVAAEKWVRLPSRRVVSILDTLIELYDKDPLDNQGNLLFSKHQSLHINELLNDPALCWKGATELRQLNEKIRNFDGIQKIKIPSQVKTRLRDYQHEGINWLQFLREYQFNGILADDMGLGKTVQALVNLLYEKLHHQPRLPSLIIAPTSLMGNWKREAQRFTPDLKILLLHGNNRKQYFSRMHDYDIVLTTYQLVLRDRETHQKSPYHYIILDESQNIKNATSKTAQVIFSLKAAHRLCLTGTPVENHLGELWSMFHFLMPGYLGTHERFSRLFRGPIEKQADEQRQKVLNKRLQPFMLRRTKEAVTKELPQKTEIIRMVPLTGQQRDLYETVRLAMDTKVQQEIGKKGLARSHIIVLDALLKLRQICCDPRLLSLDAAKQVRHSAKLAMLMEMLVEMLEEGRKVLIFSQFVKMLKLIEAELKTYGIAYTKLTGQTRKRDEAILEFQEGKVDVFLISLKAGGVGLNLTAADTVIHYDPWWNPAVEQQATDRAHRIGQDKPVFVYKLLTEATVEEKILVLQQKKQALVDALYSGKKSESALSQEELLSLLKPLEQD